MKPLTREWVDKAEGDLHTAERELSAEEYPNYDAACFHAQQCAEKYLKGVLQEQETSFPKTHNLLTLLDLVLPSRPEWEDLAQRLEGITQYAVDLRYPGDHAGRQDAVEAVDIAREVKRRARLVLGLET